ncbi:MAG: hypothetical protein EBV30_09375 [Actinobacteria bacterium]|nr:hypothetical protein [Actinomycetota bacterium]
MTDNNTNVETTQDANKKAELSDILQALKEGASMQKMRAVIEQDLRKRHGETIARMSDAELEELITNATEFLCLAPLAEAAAKKTASKALFAVNSPRWYADKAVNVLTTALGVGAAVWAGNKLGVFPGQNAANSGSTLFGKTPDNLLPNPYADTTPTKVSPRVGNSRPRSVGFDHQAS